MKEQLSAVAGAAQTSTGASTAVLLPNLEVGGWITVGARVTAVSGTTPTLDLSVEWSADGGTTWFTSQPADTFTQLTAAANVAKSFQVKARHLRIRWTIGGTTPSFTIAVDVVSGS